MCGTLWSLATPDQSRLCLRSPVASRRRSDRSVFITSGRLRGRNTVRSQCRPRLPAQEGPGWDGRRARWLASRHEARSLRMIVGEANQPKPSRASSERCAGTCRNQAVRNRSRARRNLRNSNPARLSQELVAAARVGCRCWRCRPCSRAQAGGDCRFAVAASRPAPIRATICTGHSASGSLDRGLYDKHRHVTPSGIARAQRLELARLGATRW